MLVHIQNTGEKKVAFEFFALSLSLSVKKKKLFFSNMSEFVLLSHTSALTLIVVGIVKLLLIIILSTILFDHPLTTTNKIGIAIVIIGVIMYNYSRYQSQKQHAHGFDEVDDKEYDDDDQEVAIMNMNGNNSGGDDNDDDDDDDTHHHAGDDPHSSAAATKNTHGPLSNDQTKTNFTLLSTRSNEVNNNQNYKIRKKKL